MSLPGQELAKNALFGREGQFCLIYLVHDITPLAHGMATVLSRGQPMAGGAGFIEGFASESLGQVFWTEKGGLDIHFWLHGQSHTWSQG